MDKYLIEQIQNMISELGEADIRFLHQMFTLVKLHLKKTGKL